MYSVTVIVVLYFLQVSFNVQNILYGAKTDGQKWYDDIKFLKKNIRHKQTNK